jgi:putative oxidoreductase
MTDIGLLLLRVAFGGMMAIGHGWPKFVKFRGDPGNFPDPLGIGSTMSFYGAVGAELVCGAMLVVGVLTRIAALPLAFTMIIAAFVVHKSDPFFMGGGAAKEPAVMYLCAYLAVLLLGPGRFSLDHILLKKRAVSSGVVKSAAQ